MRIVANILLAIGIAMLVPACGGSGGSAVQSPPPPPPPPPPAACNDVFPGMVYRKPDTGPEPPGIYLASSAGCRSELVYSSPDLRTRPRLYTTADLSAGTLVWGEDPGNAARYIVMRQDFTVAPDGILTLGAPVQILPRPGEEPAAADLNIYVGPDIWGGPTADEIYLTVSQIQDFVSTTGDVIDSYLIYDLNDMSQVRELFYGVNDVGAWGCPSVPNPQFVPTCYDLISAELNASGTRLYWSEPGLDGQGERWSAILRIDIEMSGNLTDWTIGEPEIVAAAPASEGPAGVTARPQTDRLMLPNPEIVAAEVTSGPSTNVTRTSIYLDADQCAALYAPLADGNSSGPADLWMQCVQNQLLVGDSIEAWQTPDSVLTVRPPEAPGVFRYYVNGSLAGTEETLIENGEYPDTGL